MFRQNFTCSALLKSAIVIVPYGAFTHYGPTFQMVPVIQIAALAWPPFARHY